MYSNSRGTLVHRIEQGPPATDIAAARYVFDLDAKGRPILSERIASEALRQLRSASLGAPLVALALSYRDPDQPIPLLGPATEKGDVSDVHFAARIAGAELLVAKGFIAFAIDWELEGDEIEKILKECGATARQLREWKENDWL